MAKFTVTLDGEAEQADDVRQAFGTLVRELRTEGTIVGVLEIDGVPYDAEDVTDEADADDATDDDAEDEVEAEAESPA